ncbi:MAG TPA: hypothetical protein VGN57_06795 [Pirellulaceae bacterium]|jgi:hypothetical protein|nr:hypothetical protein [Pirellulaceae bacterium]
MVEQNPYAAPNDDGEQPQPKLPGARTLFASTAAVALTTFGGCWVGIGAGYVGGTFAPRLFSPYEYAAVANASISGMGFGLGGGCVAGVLLVGLFYWYRSRIKRKLASESA